MPSPDQLLDNIRCTPHICVNTGSCLQRYNQGQQIITASSDLHRRTLSGNGSFTQGASLLAVHRLELEILHAGGLSCLSLLLGSRALTLEGIHCLTRWATSGAKVEILGGKPWALATEDFPG
jgi:hypothetical protein